MQMYESEYSRQGEQPLQSLEACECLTFSRNSKEACVEWSGQEEEVGN